MEGFAAFLCLIIKDIEIKGINKDMAEATVLADVERIIEYSEMGYEYRDIVDMAFKCAIGNSDWCGLLCDLSDRAQYDQELLIVKPD